MFSDTAHEDRSDLVQRDILSANDIHEFDSDAEDAETIEHGAEHMFHYEVSKLAPLAIEGMLTDREAAVQPADYLLPNTDVYSLEDEEQRIPRKSWIPSRLRQLAQFAVTRLNDDYVLGEDDDTAPSIADETDERNESSDNGMSHHHDLNVSAKMDANLISRRPT